MASLRLVLHGLTMPSLVLWLGPEGTSPANPSIPGSALPLQQRAEALQHQWLAILAWRVPGELAAAA